MFFLWMTMATGSALEGIVGPLRFAANDLGHSTAGCTANSQLHHPSYIFLLLLFITFLHFPFLLFLTFLHLFTFSHLFHSLFEKILHHFYSNVLEGKKQGKPKQVAPATPSTRMHKNALLNVETC